MSYSTSGLVETILKKVDTVDPTVNNDNTQGYSIESRWINTSTSKEWVCTDASTGAAVWVETTIGTLLFEGWAAEGDCILLAVPDGTTNYVDSSTSSHTINLNTVYTPSMGLPGMPGFYHGGGHYVDVSAGSNLETDGDLTCQILCRTTIDGGTPYMVWCGGDPISSLAAENAHYGIAISGTSIRYIHEFGAGSSAILTVPNFVFPIDSPWTVVGFTRESNVAKIYVSGNLLATSGTLTAPAGGSNANFDIGSAAGSATYDWRGSIAAVKVNTVAKSAADMLAEAKLVLG